MAFHLPFQMTFMTAKTKSSSQGRTVIPVEIREKLRIALREHLDRVKNLPDLIEPKPGEFAEERFY